jgi:hypothetical protein
MSGDDCVYVRHDGIKNKSTKAMEFNIKSRGQWIPRSVIVDEGDGVVIVQNWWAKKHGIKGDW